MLSDKILGLLNTQLNHELSNAMLYRQLSSKANLLGFLGTESYCVRQYGDELEHFNKICDYITDRNYAFKIEIESSQNPNISDVDSLMGIFQAALKRELKTTEMLSSLRQAAIDEDDQLTEQFLLWFLAEQIKEEQNNYDIIAILKVAKENPGALLLADKQIAEWEN